MAREIEGAGETNQARAHREGLAPDPHLVLTDGRGLDSRARSEEDIEPGQGLVRLVSQERTEALALEILRSRDEGAHPEPLADIGAVLGGPCLQPLLVIGIG